MPACKSGAARHAAAEVSAFPKARGTVQSLADDIMLLVLAFLEVKDIIALRQTSRKYHALTKLRWVWTEAAKRHLVHKGLLIPALKGGLRVFSREHLESRVVHHAKLNHNWHSKCPKPRRAIEFNVNNGDNSRPPRMVSKVLFMGGRNGEFLLTLAGGSLSAWEIPLDGSGVYLVAECDRFVEDATVNGDPLHPVEVVAWSFVPNSTFVQVHCLSLDTFRGCFKTIRTTEVPYSWAVPLHSLHGDNLLSGMPVMLLRPRELLSRKTHAMFRLKHDDAPNKVLAARFLGDHIVIARESVLQIFTMPVWCSVQCRYDSTDQEFATAAWVLPIKEAVIIVRSDIGPTASHPASASGSRHPLTMLVREEADGFHTVRQYDFAPNEKRGLFKNHVLPYTPPAHTFSAPIAPSSCYFRAGPSGKGVWVQTDNVETNRAKYPARCIMGFEIIANAAAGESKAGSEPSSDGPSADHIPGEESLYRCQGPLYSRRCDMGEIIRKKYSILSVDLEDAVGRIAVGDKNGKVEVLDYV